MSKSAERETKTKVESCVTQLNENENKIDFHRVRAGFRSHPTLFNTDLSERCTEEEKKSERMN